MSEQPSAEKDAGYRAAFLRANEAISVREEEIARLRFELGQALAAQVLAPAIHRNRCDMGHKDWEGCRDNLGNGCEDIAPDIAAAVLSAGVIRDMQAAAWDRCFRYYGLGATDAKNPYRAASIEEQQ